MTDARVRESVATDPSSCSQSADSSRKGTQRRPTQGGPTHLAYLAFLEYDHDWIKPCVKLSLRERASFEPLLHIPDDHSQTNLLARELHARVQARARYPAAEQRPTLRSDYRCRSGRIFWVESPGGQSHSFEGAIRSRTSGNPGLARLTGHGGTKDLTSFQSSGAAPEVSQNGEL